MRFGKIPPAHRFCACCVWLRLFPRIRRDRRRLLRSKLYFGYTSHKASSLRVRTIGRMRAWILHMHICRIVLPPANAVAPQYEVSMLQSGKRPLITPSSLAQSSYTAPPAHRLPCPPQKLRKSIPVPGNCICVVICVYVQNFRRCVMNCIEKARGKLAHFV